MVEGRDVISPHHNTWKDGIAIPRRELRGEVLLGRCREVSLQEGPLEVEIQLPRQKLGQAIQSETGKWGLLRADDESVQNHLYQGLFTSHLVSFSCLCVQYAYFHEDSTCVEPTLFSEVIFRPIFEHYCHTVLAECCASSTMSGKIIKE
jgi:hypothetical protein